MSPEQLQQFFESLDFHDKEKIRRTYTIYGRQAATEDLMRLMKRLNHRQFGSRFRVVAKEELRDSIRRYLWCLEHYDKCRNELLLTEIPLSLKEVRDADGSVDEEAIVLKGLRIYRIRRNSPSPVLLAAYSPLTGMMHRIGFANLNEIAPDLVPLVDYRGCYSLGSLLLGDGPGPLDCNETLCCMIIDACKMSTSFTSWMARPEPDSGDTLCSYYLDLLARCVDEKLDPKASNTTKLVRLMKRYAIPFDPIWGIVDEYGFPEGPLGEALRHMDKFRTS